MVSTNMFNGLREFLGRWGMAPLTLGLAVGAGAVWYIYPQVGPWPLLAALLPWTLRPKWALNILRSPFTPPLMLFLGTAVLSVWAAYDKEAALAKFWPIIGGVLLFYAFAGGLRETKTPRLYGWFLALVGGGVTIYFLATHPWEAYSAKYPALVSLGEAIQGPLPVFNLHQLNPNVVGGLLAMMGWFAGAVLWDAWNRESWLEVGLAGAILGLILFGLLMTMARGSWLALAGAIVLAGVWIASGWLARSWPNQRRYWFALLAGGGAFIVVTVVVLRPDVLYKVVEALPDLEDLNRLHLYRDSTMLALDYPFIGGGLDGFMMLHVSYVFLTHVGFSVHSHNLFLDVSIEQGLPALFALLWLWGLFALTWWQSSGNGQIPKFMGPASLALVTVALHGLVDDALYGSRAVLLLFVPLAFANVKLEEAAMNKAELTARRIFRWANGVFAGSLALAFVATAVLPNLRSYWYSNLAAVQQSRTELAVYEWPGWPLQDELRRQLELDEPVNNYKQALALNPQNGCANRRLGQIELSSGQYEDSLAHLSVGYDVMPWANAVRQLYGEALVVNGYVSEGADIWATVNNAQGQLAVREFWYTYIDDEERLAAIKAGVAATVQE